jgi:murein DD-endopeptidase MepM/ murein hydrolase activator NlpD
MRVSPTGRFLLATLFLTVLFAFAGFQSFATKVAKANSEELDKVRLATIPLHVYKQNDGLEKTGTTESWIFNVLVKEDGNQALEPQSATIEFFSRGNRIKTEQLSSAALNAIRGITFKGTAPGEFSAKAFSDQDEAFDFRHKFSEPVALAIDRLVYSLKLTTPSGKEIERSLEIPVSVYLQKTKLLFPMKGDFIVENGNVTDEGHQEWSQHFAYDIAGLGPHLELIKTNGQTIEDFYGWGREVLAPADGVVTYSRSDVPDNSRLGVIDIDMLKKLPEPMWAVGGNCVVIDHGSSEFSFLAHMQEGSVRIKAGDRVKQGQVIGLLGSSGRAQAPHLHYHLMAGSILFRTDGLPSHFDNLEVPTPKRGSYLEAK